MPLINKNSSGLAQKDVLQATTICVNILLWNPALIVKYKTKIICQLHRVILSLKKKMYWMMIEITALF